MISMQALGCSCLLFLQASKHATSKKEQWPTLNRGRRVDQPDTPVSFGDAHFTKKVSLKVAAILGLILNVTRQ